MGEGEGFARIRTVLTALLGFFDGEPQWARFLILERAGEATAIGARRQQALGELARALDREIPSDAFDSGSCSSSLMAELVVGGVFSVLRLRILDGRKEPLVELAPSLMALIVGPYQGVDGGFKLEGRGSGWAEHVSRREQMPVRATYRTIRVLGAIGASPRLSNREIADAAGLNDEGQTSKLLRRLEQRGLVENVGLGQAYGGANAWLLTACGERVLDATRHSLVPGAGAVSGRRVRGAA